MYQTCSHGFNDASPGSSSGESEDDEELDQNTQSMVLLHVHIGSVIFDMLHKDVQVLDNI